MKAEQEDHAMMNIEWNRKAETRKRYLFSDLPRIPDPLDLPRLKSIVQKADALCDEYLYRSALFGGPTRKQVEECLCVVNEIRPFSRAAAVYVGFLSSAAKSWGVDRLYAMSVQRSLRLTDETVRRLERMFFRFSDEDGLPPSVFLRA